MANIRINDLPEVSSVTSASEYVLEQGGESFKITLAGLLDSGETNISGVDITATGNFVAQGDATLKGVVTVASSSVLMNSDQTSATNDAFFEVERGSGNNNVALQWDENSDTWQFAEYSSGAWELSKKLKAKNITAETSLNSNGEIVLNSNVTGTPSLDATIRVERGSVTDATLTWNETGDYWEFSNPVRASNFSNSSGVSYALSDVEISTGAGLTGGGTLADNTISIEVPPGGITSTELDNNITIPTLSVTQTLVIPTRT